MLTGSVLIVYIVVSLHIPWLPESVAVVVYGIIIGIIVRFTGSPLVNGVVTFDPEKFFLFILPTIIFECGFSLPKTDFFQNIVAILLFAVVGTFISFFVTGGGVWLMGHIGWSIELPASESFALGAILSSTDPVSILALFNALNVDSTLYMLVLGESILNDAASIMLYRTTMDFHANKIWLNILAFFGLLKIINFGKFPALETIFMIMFSYTSYVLANSLDISGILSVFFCGITFNQYGAYSLSPYTKLTSRQLFRTAAFICETCVFIYIGITSSFHKFSFQAAVFPICYLINKVSKKHKIPLPIQVALWGAGLRGAIAFSLSLDYESPHADVLRTAVLLVVIFTMFVFGIGTYPLLKLLGIKMASSDQSLNNITKVMNKKTKNKERTSTYQSFDDKYLKKWFRKKMPPLAK
eukprot:gene7435-8700_t